MENGFEATIFTPSDSIDWRPTSLRLVYAGYGLVLTSFILSYLFESDSYVLGTGLLGFIITAIGAVWGWTEKEQPNGRIYGKLRVNEDTITINQISYDWEKISDFSFNLLQVLNEYLHTSGYRGHGGPAYSAGVDSYIEFTYDSEQLEIFFQVDTASHYVDISNAMKKLHFLGKVPLQRTYNGLHLSYEEIQELKKEKIEFNKKSMN